MLLVQDMRVVYNEVRMKSKEEEYGIDYGRVVILTEKQTLRIIPLGGVAEAGKNMTALVMGEDILIIDVGLAFPDEELLGIDAVIPDFSYLVEHKDKIKGIILTHGHEDHIGGLPYLLEEFKAPIYGTKLTLGLLASKLQEHKMDSSELDLHEVKPRGEVDIGIFQVEFIRVNHSIADGVGLAIKTPLGMVVHSGDFKFDHTPVDREVIDLHRFSELGEKGVLLFFSDSTNADRPGYTESEQVVGENLQEIFREVKGRIILTTFASNVHRIQQALEAAALSGRKAVVVGRSMIHSMQIAIDLGYLKVPDDLLMVEEVKDEIESEHCMVLTTGVQGEPISALTKIAFNEHESIRIREKDTVVLAATPIPGNEKLVTQTVDGLQKQGAKVIYEADSGVHVSGHASKEELKTMLNLVKPRYLIPIHGEYRKLVHLADLAQGLGIPRERIFITEPGDVLEFTSEGATASGKIAAGKVLVDGLGVGDVGNVVLRDRRQLSQDGILIVTLTLDKKGNIKTGPEMMSRGFVYVRESEELIEEAKEKVSRALEKHEGKTTDWSTLKTTVRDVLGKFLYEKTRRRPMILPVIMEMEKK